MIESEKKFAVYLGENTHLKACGFVMEGNFACVLEIVGENAEKNLISLNNKLRDFFYNNSVETLAGFANQLDSLLKHYLIKSFSAVYFYHNKLYAYSINAMLFLRRHNNFYKVIFGSHRAVGSIEDKDLFILATSSFPHVISLKKLSSLLNKHNNLKEVIVEINETHKEQKKLAAACLLLQPKTPLDSQSTAQKFRAKINKPLIKTPRLKIAFIKHAVFFLVLLLVLWRVGLLIQNTIKNKRSERFEKTTSSLKPKIKELQSRFFTDPSATMKEIKEIKKEFLALEKSFPEKTIELLPLKKDLEELETTLGNTQITEAKVFFDLKLINKSAKADVLDVAYGYLTLLDKTNNKVYLVNAKTKEYEVFSLNKLEAPLFVTNNKNQEVLLFDNKKGVLKLGGEKNNVVIPRDENWGEIIDLKTFANNIYLLDKKNDEIFKYIPTESGYSAKISYFQTGQSINLENATSMAVDFSVYILDKTKVWKYTSGVKDDLTLDPNKNLVFERLVRIYKQDTNFLYVLDPPISRVIAYDKNGKLIKSIFNPKLKKTRFFGVLNDEKILFLFENKVYTLDNF